MAMKQKKSLADGSKSQRVDIHYKFIGYMGSLGEVFTSMDSINGIPMEENLEQMQKGSA